MKPKTRKMPHQEYDALERLLHKAGYIYESSAYGGSDFSMLTGDMLPTQSMQEARWILVQSDGEPLILQVDGANDAIILIRD